MTKKLTLVEVKKAREENTPVMFNCVAAIDRAIATPPSAKKVTGDFAANILAIFNGAKDKGITELKPNQVREGLLGGGMDKSSHDVSTKLWNMAKSGALVRNKDAGTYGLP